MKRTFGVGRNDRVLWAMCIAAYVLMADYYSPLSIVRAELDDGSMVEERPFGATPSEDRFIVIVATLAMYAALSPDTYVTTCPDQMPETLMDMIAEMLRDRGEMAKSEDVLNERDRLLGIASDILRKKHMYHLQLAAALMKGPVTTGMIEDLKAKYCEDMSHVA